MIELLPADEETRAFMEKVADRNFPCEFAEHYLAAEDGRVLVGELTEDPITKVVIALAAPGAEPVLFFGVSKRTTYANRADEYNSEIGRNVALSNAVRSEPLFLTTLL